MYVFEIFKKYKIKTKQNQIYDVVRSKFVHATPEERVRQQTLQFLMSYLNVPPECIGVEIGISTLGIRGNCKRIDIGIFNSSGILIGIVECKANYIGTSEAPFYQVIDYINTLGARFYFVVDGRELDGYYYDEPNDQFVKMESIPTFDEMINV